MDNFSLIMISAGFEHGGNVLQRHFDGHSKLFVYPFESQLGNHDFKDFLSSIERVQYRYPEFPESKTIEESYEMIIDEELKTFLRKRTGSKFRDVNLEINEKERIEIFKEFLLDKNLDRKNIIQAFFVSTLGAWKNYHIQENLINHYLGYSPGIILDAPRIIQDFPDCKLIHLVRNPFSAYSDTKRRPFPHSIAKYAITWNVYHSVAQMYANLYPSNIKIVRYEDLIGNKPDFMKKLCQFVNLDFEDSMAFPSWNGVEITGDISPWGTVLRSDMDYNSQAAHRLTNKEKQYLLSATKPLLGHFEYQKIDYLSEICNVDQTIS